MIVSTHDLLVRAVENLRDAGGVPDGVTDEQLVAYAETGERPS